MQDDDHFDSYQHLIDGCTGRWIDVSSLKQSAARCSGCGVTRTPQNPGDPPPKPVAVDTRKSSIWPAVLLATGLIVTVLVIIWRLK